MKKTLLVIAPSVGYDCPFHILVAETGEHLASHFCTNERYAYGDLYADRKERIEEWTKRFGEFEVKYLNQTEITPEDLFARNEVWYNSHKHKAI